MYPFDLAGHGFGYIPSDAVGIVATDNNAPLANRYSDNPSANMVIMSKSEDAMRLSYSYAHQISVPLYLGAIVSSDRSEVYWINENRPLP